MLEWAAVLIVVALALLSVAVGAKELTNPQRAKVAWVGVGLSLSGTLLAILSKYN